MNADLTRDMRYVLSRESYGKRVCGAKPSLALAMLDLWSRPWSYKFLRFAAHAGNRANHVIGLDVLELG